MRVPHVVDSLYVLQIGCCAAVLEVPMTLGPPKLECAPLAGGEVHPHAQVFMVVVEMNGGEILILFQYVQPVTTVAASITTYFHLGLIGVGQPHIVQVPACIPGYYTLQIHYLPQSY